jgi:hypothetical protein
MRGTRSSRDLYGFYVKLGGTLSWAKWRDVVSTLNQEVMDVIIYEGREFDMGSNLSRISVIRIDRNHSAPRVDWSSTHALKKELLAEGKELMTNDNPEGTPYLVYYTDDWYCRFYWEKFGCKVRNKSAYRFDATRGLKGNKTRLVQLLQSDSTAHLIYDKVTK